jgi:hypothetical protein
MFLNIADRVSLPESTAEWRLPTLSRSRALLTARLESAQPRTKTLSG